MIHSEKSNIHEIYLKQRKKVSKNSNLHLHKSTHLLYSHTNVTAFLKKFKTQKILNTSTRDRSSYDIQVFSMNFKFEFESSVKSAGCRWTHNFFFAILFLSCFDARSLQTQQPRSLKMRSHKFKVSWYNKKREKRENITSFERFVFIHDLLVAVSRLEKIKRNSSKWKSTRGLWCNKICINWKHLWIIVSKSLWVFVLTVLSGDGITHSA